MLACNKIFDAPGVAASVLIKCPPPPAMAMHSRQDGDDDDDVVIVSTKVFMRVCKDSKENSSCSFAAAGNILLLPVLDIEAVVLVEAALVENVDKDDSCPLSASI